MEKRIYITAEEREKCRKAADVFVVMAKGIFAHTHQSYFQMHLYSRQNSKNRTIETKVRFAP